MESGGNCGFGGVARLPFGTNHAVVGGVARLNSQRNYAVFRTATSFSSEDRYSVFRGTNSISYGRNYAVIGGTTFFSPHSIHAIYGTDHGFVDTRSINDISCHAPLQQQQRYQCGTPSPQLQETRPIIEEPETSEDESEKSIASPTHSARVHIVEIEEERGEDKMEIECATMLQTGEDTKTIDLMDSTNTNWRESTNDGGDSTEYYASTVSTERKKMSQIQFECMMNHCCELLNSISL